MEKKGGGKKKRGGGGDETRVKVTFARCGQRVVKGVKKGGRRGGRKYFLGFGLYHQLKKRKDGGAGERKEKKGRGGRRTK